MQQYHRISKREIIRSLMSMYFCGGSCVEDVTSHLMRHLSYHPTMRKCSSDTILRAIKEPTQENISYTSDQGKTYNFNTADKLNALILNALISTGDLKEEEGYDVDFDHQFLETEKYDAKPATPHNHSHATKVETEKSLLDKIRSNDVAGKEVDFVRFQIDDETADILLKLQHPTYKKAIVNKQLAEQICVNPDYYDRMYLINCPLRPKNIRKIYLLTETKKKYKATIDKIDFIRLNGTRKAYWVAEFHLSDLQLMN